MAEVLRLVARQPATEARDVAGAVRRVCAAAAESLAACGTAVSIMAAAGVRGVTTGSDQAVERTEAVQFALRQGPGIEAFASRRPVLVPDLSHRSGSWPAYVAAVGGRGIRAVFAFPLQIGAAQLGVFDVYRRRPGRLSVGQLDRALAFAEVAVLTLVDGQRRAATGVADGQLEQAYAHRAELYQAQGMVMVQLGVDLVEAWERIRACAFVQARSLLEVSHDVVARRIKFDSSAGCDDV